MRIVARSALGIVVALVLASVVGGGQVTAGGGGGGGVPGLAADISVVVTAPSGPVQGQADVTITVINSGGLAETSTLTTTLVFSGGSASSLTGDTAGCTALTATGFSCAFGDLGTGAQRMLVLGVSLGCAQTVDVSASVTTTTPETTGDNNQSQVSREGACGEIDPGCYDDGGNYLCDNPCYNPETGEYSSCEECVPDPPSAGPDQFVNEGDEVTLAGDLGLVCLVPTIAWTQIAGPPVTLSETFSLSPTFTAPPVNAPTVLTFQLEAGETDTVDIVVNPVGAPVVTIRAVRHTAGGDVPYVPGTWSREQVTVYFSCTDDSGAGLVSSFPAQKNYPGDGVFQLPQPGWSCSDADGHEAEVEAFVVMIDRHAPTCSVSPLVQYVPSDGAMHTRTVTVSGQDGLLPASALVFKLLSVSGAGVAGWDVGSSTPSLDVKGKFLGVPGPAHVITYQVTDPAGWSQTCAAKVATAR